MYYFPDRKLAFVLPTRTGSTVLSYFLENNGGLFYVRMARIQHIQLHEIELENFDQYAVYGFFRDPLDRFLSCLRNIQQFFTTIKKFMDETNIPKEDFLKLNYDQLLDVVCDHKNPEVHRFLSPQVAWLANVNLLNFKNYTAEFLRVARLLDKKEVRLGVINSTVKSSEIPSQRIIDYVYSKYADDYRLGKEKGLLT